MSALILLGLIEEVPTKDQMCSPKQLLTMEFMDRKITHTSQILCCINIILEGSFGNVNTIPISRLQQRSVSLVPASLEELNVPEIRVTSQLKFKNQFILSDYFLDSFG